MARRDQEKFVIEYLKTNYTTDIYDQNFHEQFYQRFGGKRTIYPFGSCPVHKAQRLLTRMYRFGMLDRDRVPLSGHEPGFRNWVYGYTLPHT